MSEEIKQIIEDWDYDCAPVEDLIAALNAAGYVIVPKTSVKEHSG